MSEIPITVFGNVVSDVRSISTRTGATLSSFRMAVNNRKFSKTTNTWIDLDTTYLTVNCWRQLGDHVLVSVKRGDPVLVAGRLRVRDWSTEDKSGTVVEVEAMSVGHDLSRGTATFSRFKREQAEDDAISAITPWEAENADRMASLAATAGVALDSLDAELMEVSGEVERKSA